MVAVFQCNINLLYISSDDNNEGKARKQLRLLGYTSPSHSASQSSATQKQKKQKAPQKKAKAPAGTKKNATVSFAKAEKVLPSESEKTRCKLDGDHCLKQ